jgi:photosystem II stability/assembly factor-like uncharacterized protein
MPRRTHLRPTLAAFLGCALALLLATIDARTSSAQDAPTIAWTRADKVSHLFRLFTPTSGALLAVGEVKDAFLVRSDDGGVTWRFINLPSKSATPDLSPLVDPSDHTKVYLAANAGLFKTDDDAESWHVILPTEAQGETIRALEVSPADPSTVYVQVNSVKHTYSRLLRSSDGGGTWEIVEDRRFSAKICDEFVSLLRAHPTDPNRLFRVASCNGNTSPPTLQHSRERGATWERLYAPVDGRISVMAIDGSQAPGRLLLGLTTRTNGTGSRIVRSVDDGATWSTVLDNADDQGEPTRAAQVSISGLAINETQPDQVVASFVPGFDARGFTARMMMSMDGGQSWSEISSAGMYYPQDVAFGIDGKTIYVADGAWRAPAP